MSLNQMVKGEKIILLTVALIAGTIIVALAILGLYTDIGLGIIISILAVWGIVKIVKIVKTVSKEEDHE